MSDEVPHVITVQLPFEKTNRTLNLVLNSYSFAAALKKPATKKSTIRLFLGIVVTTKLENGESVNTLGTTYFECKDGITFKTEDIFDNDPSKKPQPKLNATDSFIINQTIINHGFPMTIPLELPNIELKEKGEFSMKVQMGFYQVYTDYQVEVLQKFFKYEDNLEFFAKNVTKDDKENLSKIGTLLSNKMRAIPHPAVQIGLDVLNNIPEIISVAASVGHMFAPKVRLVSSSLIKLYYDRSENAMKLNNLDLGYTPLAGDKNFVRVADIGKEVEFNRGKMGKKSFKARPTLVFTLGNQPAGSVRFINPLTTINNVNSQKLKEEADKLKNSTSSTNSNVSADGATI